MANSHDPPGSSPGPAVDRTGQPVIDPTQNVLDLVRAAIERQDNLRAAEARHLQELAGVRHAYEKQLRAGDRHQADLRSSYEEKLREKETARIDAIRAVDVGAAAILANQVAASAEALRGQVEAARQQTATALAAALEPIQKDIQDLRRAQYEAQGKQGQVVETSTTARDDVALEQARIQAAAQRTQVYALIVAALILAIGLYTAFHK